MVPMDTKFGSYIFNFNSLNILPIIMKPVAYLKANGGLQDFKIVLLNVLIMFLNFNHVIHFHIHKKFIKRSKILKF